MPRLLTNDEIDRQLTELDSWTRTESEGEAALTATFELTDFVAALDLVNQVGRAAELMNHHPDIDIRWNKVTLVLTTHSEGGVTQLDIEAAHRFAEEIGLAAGAPE